MNKTSAKQRKINTELARIKKCLPRVCCFCGGRGDQLAHLLPRGRFPQYADKDWNVVIACQTHHTRFDTDKAYRKKQIKLYLRVIDQVRDEDRGLVNNHFDIWEE